MSLAIYFFVIASEARQSYVGDGATGRDCRASLAMTVSSPGTIQ
jgi:hypothetical protein